MGGFPTLSPAALWLVGAIPPIHQEVWGVYGFRAVWSQAVTSPMI
jgi:hypothetical protein